MATPVPLTVKVWGAYACFTRPEMKAERVSYPVITPSAARGVLEAIFWKPEVVWQICEIWVLKPIRYFSVLRHEVQSKVAPSTVREWARTGGGYWAEEDRARRHTRGLRDVAYIIQADLLLAPHAAAESLAKYRAQFRRRVHRGQCYHQPYLGCREFVASFGNPDGTEQRLDINEDMGRMLFDLAYESGVSGRGTPQFFTARLEHGRLKIPQALYTRQR